MRKYKPALFPEVDLDDPKTYEYLPKTHKELDALMFKEIGYALVYMDYFPDRKGLFPKRKRKEEFVKVSSFGKTFKNNKNLIDINNCSYYQRQRVYKLIDNFAKNRRNNYDNILWYQEQIFLFQDEIENMC